MSNAEHKAMIVAMAEAMALAEYYDLEPEMYDSRDQFLTNLRANHHSAGGTDFLMIAQAGVAAQLEFFLTRNPSTPADADFANGPTKAATSPAETKEPT